MKIEPNMQTTYQVRCKCGHDFPIPAQFLSTDEDERAALIKALEGLLCPDCIQAAINELHALREHLLKSGAVPPDITEVGWRTLARDARKDILRENIIPPPPSRSPDIFNDIMHYPEPPYVSPQNGKFPISEDAWKAWRALNITELGWRDLAKDHTIPEEVLATLHEIDRWNRYHPVGTEVFVLPPGDEQPPGLLGSKTTSPARMHHGKVVVDVAEHGPIELDRLIEIPPQAFFIERTPSDECMHYPDGL